MTHCTYCDGGPFQGHALSCVSLEKPVAGSLQSRGILPPGAYEELEMACQLLRETSRLDRLTIANQKEAIGKLRAELASGDAERRRLCDRAEAAEKEIRHLHDLLDQATGDAVR